MTDADRVSLSRVAERAGVSVSTASRALRHRGEMGAATRARVLQAARDLGYERGRERRGRPRAGASRLFDLVLGHFHDPYSDEVTAGAHLAAAAHDRDLVLTAERDTPDDDWPMRIRERGSAGVVLGLILPTTAQRRALHEAGIPIVLMDPRADASLPLISVRTTDRRGGEDAATHLLEQGVRRFVVIAGAPSYRFGRARVDGFESVVRERVPEAPIVRVQAEWMAPHARRASAPALAGLAGEGPIGVFAISDEMAIGAYRAALDLGLGIPDDVMVVGFDDVRGARWVQPSLTTVRQPIREMAAAAIDALADVADGGDATPRVIELPTRLVVRGSTTRPEP